MISQRHVNAAQPKLNPADSAHALLIDTLSLAAHVEIIAAQFLEAYPVGLYLTYRNEPVLNVGETYTIQNPDGTVHSTFVVDGFNIPKYTGKNHCVVLNKDNVEVLRTPLLSALSYAPQSPGKGMKIVENYIRKLVNDHAHWPNGCSNNEETLEDVVQPFLLPQWHATPDDTACKRLVLDKLYDSIEAALYELRIQMFEFLGKDRWIMHFVKQNPRNTNTIRVEKTINYKVYDWDRRMASGQWKVDDAIIDEPEVDEKTQIHQQTLNDIRLQREQEHRERYGIFQRI